MVHLLPVAQFVHHHIVPNFFRGKHQQAVEIQISFAGAAAPSGALSTDGNGAVGYANQRRKPGRTFGNILRSLFCQGLQLLGRQLRRGRPGGDFLQVGVDPVCFAVYKLLHLPFGHPVGTANQNFSLRGDLESKGFPAAAQDSVFHSVHFLFCIITQMPCQGKRSVLR